MRCCVFLLYNENPREYVNSAGFLFCLITLVGYFFNLAIFIDECFIYKAAGFIYHFESFTFFNRCNGKIYTVLSVFFHQMHLDHIKISVGKDFGIDNSVKDFVAEW